LSRNERGREKQDVPETSIDMQASAREPRRPQRTCVGCGAHEHPSELVRVVLGPDGNLAVDLAGKSSFGRGAWLHASPSCLEKGATRGLSRSFRAKVRSTPEALAAAIVEAADRRITGLLVAAFRSKQATLGADAVSERATSGEVDLVVVACDAAAAASLPVVQRAVAQGRAVAWGTKNELGALAGRAEVAVVGIQSATLAEAIRATVRMSSNVASKVVAAEVR